MEKDVRPGQGSRTGQWRRKFNQSLKEELKIVTINGFIKSQKIEWLEHIMRYNTGKVTKIVFHWKPNG